MKKTYTLLFALMLLFNLKSQNETSSTYVSSFFNCIISQNIHTNLDNKSLRNIYAISDSMLFIVNQQEFLNKTHNGYAKISKINAFRGIEETYFISPSSKYTENGGKIERIWIWALAANDTTLCMAVDEEIWIYHYTTSNQFQYLKSISFADVSYMKIVNNMLHIFVDNDEGFDWFKVNLLNDQTVKIGHLTLNNRFSMQIAPVKLISIENNALYFLQRNEPIIEKYSLSGDLIAYYRIEIPNWKKIPTKIVQKLDSIEDISERNYAFSKFSIFDYNIMHLFYVFPCERFFMIAIDKNEVTNTYITPYFIQIIGDSTIIVPCSTTLNESEKYENSIFPFLTASAEGNVLFAQINEYVTQINKSTNVSWQNKTQQEFKREENLFYKNNDPLEKIETYRFIKNHILVDSIQLLDYDDTIFLLNDIKKDKAIFIISQYPQCTTCAKVIWNYFSNKKLPNIELYNVTLDCSTYLMKKENIKEVNLFLKTEYTPLYINTKELNDATKQILSQKSNPIILLFDKKLQHIEVISSDNIIGDLMGNLKLEFLHTIDNFIEN